VIYKHSEARSAQAKGCLEELDSVLKKWNFKLVPSLYPFIINGYDSTVLNLAEGIKEQ